MSHVDKGDEAEFFGSIADNEKGKFKKREKNFRVLTDNTEKLFLNNLSFPAMTNEPQRAIFRIVKKKFSKTSEGDKKNYLKFMKTWNF